LKAFGKIQLNEDRMAYVLAPLPGQVVHLSVKVGDSVRLGEVLFMINSRDVTAAVGEYIDSRKDLELSEKTHAMTQTLFEGQACSAIALKQAENDLSKARGRQARAGAVIKTLGVELHGEELTSFVPVRSPIAGTVIDRKVTEGQYETGDSTAFLTIADLSSVTVVADLFERDLSRVRPGQKAELTTLAYPDRHFAGEVWRISDVVDPNTRTLKVRIQVPNPEGRLKPEMFASVLLIVKEPELALTIDARAAFMEGGEHFVFVERAPSEYEIRRVDVVPAPDGRLQVREGLKAGDRVVKEDVMLLRAQESSDERF
jgi:cobalt-zinc-cadmium efflux system membrane fusion protein